ncbi:MAG: phosphoglucosamine mutase [Lamprocystis purpurea]|jgi:phosphoglucosamine mutase|uniref:phosphoglucosamine mutase n=1 Tax=Lamprocystis purpurea TaxID=61598 RepID=UPI00036DF235|nr:phosphoglucosamine mutase [Lamprocystis purpurea]MBV5272991.1 phosphoglucosamine mutase [Lamprocystis purpurea]
MRKYFGTDGIRGRVGEANISPDFVLKLGWAAGRVLGHGAGSKILIGKDTRISGYMFESALEAGLVASGVNIRLLGPMSTPGVAYLTRTFRACAGIVITASHNPYQDNGIKFFSADGDKLPDAVELAIEAELEQPLRTVDAAALGKVKRIEDANGRYIEFCKSTIPPAMDFHGLKIVVDCAHGATYNTAPYVFDELGATVVAMGNEPDGLNINHNVGSTHPQALCETVVREGADLGIAFDGDGDRVLMVNSRGQLIDGDQLLYIIARARLHEGTLRGEVVGTLMSNLGFEHALHKIGVGFARTAVGDRFIMEHMKRTDSVLGGEPSGHIICRDRTSTGDGIVSALQVLAALQRLDADFDALCAEVTLYPQILINIRLNEQRDLVNLPAVQDAVFIAERELAGRGRVLLRPSGTEPLVRVMVEGADGDQVKRLAEGLADVVRNQQPGSV